MRISSIHPVYLRDRLGRKEIITYEKNELDRLFRSLIVRGYITSAYTLYSQAIRSMRSGDYMGLRNVLRKMRNILSEPKREENSRIAFEGESDEITLVDGSNDPNVSFKSPASVPAFAAELFITAHEGEHARRILREALLKGKRANVIVRIFYRYDSKGRIIAVGGVTKAEIVERVKDTVFEAVA